MAKKKGYLIHSFQSAGIHLLIFPCTVKDLFQLWCPHPFTLKISLIILSTVCYTVLMILVWTENLVMDQLIIS